MKVLSKLVKNLYFFHPVSRINQRTDISQCQTKYCIKAYTHLQCQTFTKTVVTHLRSSLGCLC